MSNVSNVSVDRRCCGLSNCWSPSSDTLIRERFGSSDRSGVSIRDSRIELCYSERSEHCRIPNGSNMAREIRIRRDISSGESRCCSRTVRQHSRCGGSEHWSRESRSCERFVRHRLHCRLVHSYGRIDRNRISSDSDSVPRCEGTTSSELNKYECSGTERDRSVIRTCESNVGIHRSFLYEYGCLSDF